jgi:hypothetical protein
MKFLFTSLNRRLEAIDHMVSELVERSERLSKSQARTERRLDRLEQHTSEVEA